jgi:hypothetical protein
MDSKIKIALITLIAIVTFSVVENASVKQKEYNIVVADGTSGMQAAISAAKTGIEVLVVEFKESLDDVNSPVLIEKSYHDHNVGFVPEVFSLKDALEPKMEWCYTELEKDGLQKSSKQTLEDASTQLDNNWKGPKPVKKSSNNKRTKSLREIVLARALYKCGDYNNIGKNILGNYRKDLRGLFVIHANEILKGG